MAIKFKVIAALMCAVLFATGFVVSAYALTPVGTPCGILCKAERDECLNNGTFPEQCQMEYLACILDCT